MTSELHRHYSVTTDGRFLLARPSLHTSNELHIVFNWTEEIRARFGAK